MNSPLPAVLIGTGNIAWHLVRCLPKGAVQWLGVAGRDKERTASFVKEFDVPALQLDALPPANIYFLAVPDRVIAQVATKIPNTNALVVHHSGAVSLDALKNFERAGVLYPFQSLSQKIAVNPLDLPFYVEGSTSSVREELRNLLAGSAHPVLEANSEERLALHVAGVLVNNFTNHLFATAYQWVEQNQLDPKHLQPLMRETLRKALEGNPKAVQTGPAKRKDFKTIKKHLRLIKSQKLRRVYRVLSEHIAESHD